MQCRGYGSANMIQTMKTTKILTTAVGDILLRPYTIADIKYQISYLYDSPIEFLKEIGFDPSKFIGREEHQEKIAQRLNENSPDDFSSMVAELDGEVIAIVHFHRGDDPKAHFHIFDQSLRGKGLGACILKPALLILMNKHGLEEIKIEPKFDNLAMNKLMVKCGFQLIGTTTYSGAVTLDFKANSYKVKNNMLIDN